MGLEAKSKIRSITVVNIQGMHVYVAAVQALRIIEGMNIDS